MSISLEQNNLTLPNMLSKKPILPLIIDTNNNPNTSTTTNEGIENQKPRRRSKDSLGPVRTPTNRNYQQQQQQQQDANKERTEKKVRRRTVG